jgi:hypothetical protein
MFLIIAFRKNFKNVCSIGSFSLNFLVKNVNLKHDLIIFLRIFFVM